MISPGPLRRFLRELFGFGGGYEMLRRTTGEVVAIRAGFSLVVWWSLYSAEQMSRFDTQPKPVGLARLVDLTWLADPSLYQIGLVAALLGLAAYTLGLFPAISLIPPTLLHVTSTTLYYSQGAVHHSQQMVSMLLLTQWIVYVWGGVARLRGKSFPLPEGRRLSDAAIHYATHMLAALYVIAGVIKLIRSDGMWMWRAPNIAVEILKTNAQTYHNKLEVTETYERSMAVANWMVEHPFLCRFTLGMGFFVELFAFAFLYNRFTMLIGGLLLIGLHEGIRLTMSLVFHYNQLCCLIFLVNVPFWVGWMARRGQESAPGRLQPDFPWRAPA